MMSMETRFGGDSGAMSAPLPDLRSAVSRRAALFGAVTATGFLAAAAPGCAIGIDQQLAALADEICDTLDGAAYALEPVHDEADQDRRLGHANDLILRMVDLPAVGLAGVKAKAKAYLDSCSYDVWDSSTLSTSLAEDAERVCGGFV